MLPRIQGLPLYLCSLLSVFSLASRTALAKDNENENTTPGDTIRENTNQFGGTSDADLQNLDSESRRKYENFIKGRRSYGAGGAGRYQGSMELHDTSDGVAHDINAPEKAMNAAGAESSGVKYGGDPAKAEEARKKAGICKSKKPDNPDDPCWNVSAVVIDKGAAHLFRKGIDTEENEEHRVYGLSEEAKAKIKALADNYANSAQEDAIDVPDNLGQLGMAKTSSKQRVMVKQVDANGNVTMVEVGVGANMDKLHSEAAFLNQMGVRALDQQWRAMRATRLIYGKEGAKSINGKTGIDPNVKDIAMKTLSTNPSDIKANNQELATFIANSIELQFRPIPCNKLAGVLNLPTTSNSATSTRGAAPAVCPQANATTNIHDIQGDKTANNLAIQQESFEGLYKLAKNAGPALNPPKAELAKILACMDIDTWCPGGQGFDVPGKHYEPYDKYTGDAGAIFGDTREFMAGRFYLANTGALAKAKSTLGGGTNADFGTATDAKTKTTYYKDTMSNKDGTGIDDMLATEKLIKDDVKNEQAKARKEGWNGPDSKYLSNDKATGLNSQNQTVFEMFGRNTVRDGSTLVNAGPSVDPSALNTSSGNGGQSQSPRGPATVPSSVGSSGFGGPPQ